MLNLFVIIPLTYFSVVCFGNIKVKNFESLNATKYRYWFTESLPRDSPLTSPTPSSDPRQGFCERVIVAHHATDTETI